MALQVAHLKKGNKNPCNDLKDKDKIQQMICQNGQVQCDLQLFTFPMPRHREASGSQPRSSALRFQSWLLFFGLEVPHATLVSSASTVGCETDPFWGVNI